MVWLAVMVLFDYYSIYSMGWQAFRLAANAHRKDNDCLLTTSRLLLSIRQGERLAVLCVRWL